MKNIFLSFTFLFFGFQSIHSQNTISVEMTNFDSDKGAVIIGLYNDESSFLDKSFKKLRVPIKNKKAEAKFLDIPDGTYAIALYHDENNDREFDMFLGIPTEGYGVSNNIKRMLSKPDWKDVKFDVRDGELVTQHIEL